MEAMWGEWRCGSASYTRGEGARGGVAEEGVAAGAIAVRGALLARAVHRAQLRARNTVRVECGCDIPCCYCHLDELGGGRGAALGALSASAFCFGIIIHHDFYKLVFARSNSQSSVSSSQCFSTPHAWVPAAVTSPPRFAPRRRSRPMSSKEGAAVPTGSAAASTHCLL